MGFTGWPLSKSSVEDAWRIDKLPAQWWLWVTLLRQSCRFTEVRPAQYLVISAFLSFAKLRYLERVSEKFVEVNFCMFTVRAYDCFHFEFVISCMLGKCWVPFW